MEQTITLAIAHPELPPGPIAGFRFFWAYYVNGFRPHRHCQPCFKGKLVTDLCTGRARSGATYSLDAMDWYPYTYICGVGASPKKNLAGRNFHLPLRYAPGEKVTPVTYNGYVVTAQDAIALSIPELPPGCNGRDPETTRCKNFRFAVAAFGYPAM